MLASGSAVRDLCKKREHLSVDVDVHGAKAKDVCPNVEFAVVVCGEQ